MSCDDVKHWHYRTEHALDDAQLNQLGAEGWELVDVEHELFYLKRPAPAFRDRMTLEQKVRYYAKYGIVSGADNAR